MFQLESSDDLGRKLMFPLVKVKTTIGRDPNCDIVLEDEDVSRHHARIYVMGEVVKIKDEGSVNGTYVNNGRIAEMTEVPVGGELIVGSNQFFLRSSPDAPTADNLQLTTMLTVDQLRDMTQNFDALLDDVPAPAADMPETAVMHKNELLENIYNKRINFRPHASLEIIFGPDKGKKYLLTPGEHRLGRGTNCNVHLTDPMVSGLHGTIEVTAEQIVYTDEGSRNGTVLNNKLVTTHPLRHRDVLVIGNTKLKFLNPMEAKLGPHKAPDAPPVPRRMTWLAQYGVWVAVGAAVFGLIILLIVLFGWR
jgi:pSer/pThr/pTyr-binding forkhead associated (FHA) protein